MNKTRLKLPIKLIFICLIFIFIFGCKKQESIRIGVILSSTGSGSHMSETLNGIIMAADEINEWGGIDERPLELIIRDNETNPEKAEELFREIEAEYKPELYLCALSQISMALAPIADEYEAPLLCLVSSNTELTDVSPWVFRFYVSAAQEIDPVKYFTEKLKLSETGVIYRDDLLGTFVLKLYKEGVKNSGLRISEFPFQADNRDLSAVMNDIKDLESVYVVGYATDMAEILTQLGDADFSGIIIAHSAACQAAVRALPAAEGICVAAPLIYNKNDPAAFQLKTKFEKLYNRQLNHYGANGYEALKILATLFEGKDISRDLIRSELTGGFIYSGSLGKISVQKGSRDFNFDLMPAVIENGSLIYE